MNLQDLHDSITALLKAGVPPTTPVTLFERDNLNDLNTLVEVSYNKSDYLLSGVYLADPSPRLNTPSQSVGVTYTLVSCEEDMCELLNAGAHKFKSADEIRSWDQEDVLNWEPQTASSCNR